MLQSKNRKILVIAESIDVEDSSGSKANVALINNLHKAGFVLLICHYTRKKIQLEGIECISLKENRKSLLFFLSRAERFLRYKFKLFLHRPLEKAFGFSFTLFNDRNSIVASLKKVDFAPDLVLTLSKGGSFRPHHALLKLLEWHSKWIAYIHDPYPMHHYPKPYTWTEPGAEEKETFIRKISEKAAHSAFPSLLLKEWMSKFYPAFLKTGIIIPHQMFKDLTVEAELPEFFNPDNFNLLHAGNLLGARNPGGLIEAFRIFLNEKPEAKTHSRLLFIGGKNPHLTIASSDENILISDGYMDFKTVYQMQNRTSVNIILEAKADISPFLPGKFPHCIEAQRPILLLGPAKSEARRLLGNDYEFWSEIDDVQEIKKNIEKQYLLWQNKENFKFKNSEKLHRYLGPEYLKQVIDSLSLEK